MSAAHKDDQVLDLGSEKYSDYHSAILLASVALTAFAGAAAAEVSFNGTGVLGYNNDTNAAAGADDNYDGFYWEGTLNIGASAELDNGLTAAGSFNFEFMESDNANSGQTLSSDDFVVSLSSDTASLTFGDTGTSANKMWKSAGDMEADGFTSDWTDFTNSKAVLRGDVSFGNVAVSASTVIDSEDQAAQTSVGISADLGMATVVAAYEEAPTGTLVAPAATDANGKETTAVSVAFDAAGATVVVAYADNSTNESTGVKVTYPMGDVTVAAYYVDESNGDANLGLNVAYAAGPVSVSADFQDDQGESKTGVNMSYDMGNGLALMAGYYDEESWADAEMYVAASYDLGGGAALLVSYVDEDIENDDEVGPNDYQLGTTVELSFAF
jgi:hypothetical protein